MSNSLMLLTKYQIKLVNHRIDKKDYRETYDVKITNTEDKTSVIIDTYKPSPLLKTQIEKLNDAMSFIVSVANEFYSDHRDDGDNFFENVYNDLHKVMSNDDMDTLYLDYHSLEDE